MRKAFGAFIMAALLAWGSAVCAEPGEPPDPEAAGGSVLTILNTDLFEGMEQTYSEGYMPQVKDGAIQLVLPLASREPLADDAVTVQVQAADDAPVILPTYDRTVVERAHTAVSADGAERDVCCFLVSFSLPLAESAAAGRWPLTLTASGQTQSGTAFTESFTVYVTVPQQSLPQPEEPLQDVPHEPDPDPGAAGTSVNGGNAPDSSAAQSTPPPHPRLMLTSLQTSSWPVSAGQDFSVEAVLKNMSRAQAVTNVLVTLAPAGDALTPQAGQTLSFHFDRIPAEGTVSLTVLLHADGSAEPGTQRLTVNYTYEGKENEQYTGEDEILLALVQPVRLTWDIPEVPRSVHAGDTLNLAFQALNMGKTSLYNVRITLEGQGLRPENSLFLGNIDGGQAAQGEMYVFVGLLDADDPERKYGTAAGTMTLTAESAEGEVTTLSEAFETTIEAPLIETALVQEEKEPEEDTSFQWILVSVVAAAVIAVLLTAQITRRKYASKEHQAPDSQ